MTAASTPRFGLLAAALLAVGCTVPGDQTPADKASAAAVDTDLLLDQPFDEPGRSGAPSAPLLACGGSQCLAAWLYSIHGEGNIFHDTYRGEVRARRLSARAEPLGAPLMPLHATQIQYEALFNPIAPGTPVGYSYPQPHIAMDGAGNFVVAWTEAPEEAGPALSLGLGNVYFRRFAADGTPLGEISSTGLLAEPNSPNIAMAPDGRFVVTWRYNAVLAQAYAADGTPAGALPAVVATPLDDPLLLASNILRYAVAMAADGSYIVSWHSDSESLSALRARIYRPDGSSSPILTLAEVANETGDLQNILDYALAMAADGSFSVAWTEMPPGAYTISAMARSFSRDGAPLGEPLLLGAHDWANHIALAVSPDGQRAIAAWEAQDAFVNDQGFNALHDFDVHARYFRPGAGPLAASFVANDFVPGHQNWPAAAIDAQGQALVAWYSGTGSEAAMETPHRDGLYVRAFAPP